MTPQEKAKELGSKVPFVEGINWAWANQFPDEAAASAFVEWLDANGYDHRGVYPDEHWSVRYRPW